MDNGTQTMIPANPIITNDAIIAALVYSVPLKVAGAILGKCRSELYEAANRGDLDFLKDGGKTHVTVASIRRYQQSRPRAVVKPSSIRRRRNSQPTQPTI